MSDKTIYQLTELENVSQDDELIIYDVSDTTETPTKKVKVKNFLNNSYSTEEVNTGKKWIDGKPIYRKVIDFGALPNNTSKSVAHNVSNLDWIISLEGVTKDNTNFFTLPTVETSGTPSAIFLYANATNVYVTTGINRSSFTNTYIILEYTKTN